MIIITVIEIFALRGRLQ